MKYCSIDIETTGLDPEECQILSIGAVIDDTDDIKPVEELPAFHAAVKRKNITGSTYAINMNRDLIQTINRYITSKYKEERDLIEATTGMQFFDEYDIAKEFYYWLAQNDFIDFKEPRSHMGYVTSRNGKLVPAITNNTKPIRITVAGKNFAAFDLRFLEKLPMWNELIKIRSRILDPSIIYLDWSDDETPPSLETCKKRANLGSKVAHDAVEDSMDVVRLLRKWPGYRHVFKNVDK